jgi:hypothetical protein
MLVSYNFAFILRESNCLKPMYSMYISPDRLCVMQFGTQVQNIHCFYAVLKAGYQRVMWNGTVISGSDDLSLL